MMRLRPFEWSCVSLSPREELYPHITFLAKIEDIRMLLRGTGLNTKSSEDSEKIGIIGGSTRGECGN